MNPSAIFSVPQTGSQLLGNAESARLYFSEVAEAASMAAPCIFRNLVKTGVKAGMNPVEARWKARQVSRQMMHVANLANMQMVSMRIYAVKFETLFRHYGKAQGGFSVDD